MDIPIFNPRDERDKRPYGAVPCGTSISVTLRPPVQEGFAECTLVLCCEFAGTHQEIPLRPAGTEGGRSLFAGSYDAPAQPELAWYCFRFRRGDGQTAWLGRNGLCGEGEVVCWQQTVYDDALPTPDWFGRGVTYQIFPDRFRRTFIPDPAGMLGDRVVHQNWDELMDYLPDCNGEIRNRDFFGGSLAGIEEKLDYLHELGVSTLYLCPIFESDSNHRYNTGDYDQVDPMLGTEEDLRRLCARARERGIHVMLDGVFNHTGFVSRYFNGDGFYPEAGAYQSQREPPGLYPLYHRRGGLRHPPLAPGRGRRLAPGRGRRAA